MSSKDNLELDLERVSILYANTHMGHVGMAVAVLFLYFVINEFTSPLLALYWLTAVALCSMPRLILTINFSNKLKHQKITPENARTWEHYFMLHSMLPVLSVASAIFLPYRDLNSAITFCTVAFLMLVAGGTLTYGTSLGTVMLFVNIYMLSLIGKVLLIGDSHFTLMGIFLFAGHIMLMRLILRQNKILLENITLKIENKNQSLSDPLTGLANRRQLYFFIDKLIPSSNRSGEPFSVLLLDIDHFKKYNDNYGHSAGDQLLVDVSNHILKCSRDLDLVVRYGGEEFMVVLPSTNIEQSQFIAKRICDTIKENTEVTISAGIATYSHNTSFDDLIIRADKALYKAKASGRDRFMVAAV